MPERKYTKDPKLIRETSGYTFEGILASDVPTIFTKRQKEVIEAYRDGAASHQEVADKVGITRNGVLKIKERILERLVDSFGHTLVPPNISKAVGISILAGWVEPRDFEIKQRPSEAQVHLIHQALEGFEVEEAARLKYMDQEIYKGMLAGIKDKLNVSTNEEMVAWLASDLRNRLLKTRARREERNA